MWMKFPPGIENISVEQQAFTIEHSDKEGNNYFRVPDHFAGTILMLKMGFVAQNPPADSNPPADLPKQAQALADAQNAVQLAGLATAATAEASELRAQLAEITVERDDLKLKVTDLEAHVANLEGDNKDLTEALESARASAKSSDSNTKSK